MTIDDVDGRLPVERGTRLELRPQGARRTYSLPVFSVGRTYLHFLVEPDSKPVEAFRRENRVTVLDGRGEPRFRGTVQIVDVGPEQRRASTSEEPSDPTPEKHLLRVRVDRRRCGERWSGPEVPRPSVLRAWLAAFRPELLSASLVPMLLGWAYPLWMGWPFQPRLAVLTAAAALCMHLGANLHNDVSDHWRGVDLYGGEGGSGAIQRGWLSPRQVFRAALLFFLLGLLLGAPLVWLRGGDLLVVSLLGFVGALGYSQRHFGYKYTGLGDLCVFLLLGPLMVLGSALAVSGQWDAGLVLASLPMGFFVALILHGNNVSDLYVDRRAGVTTLAMLLGFRGSQLYYEVMLVAGYGLIGILALLGLIPAWTLFTFVTLPLAWRNRKRVRSAQNPSNPVLGRVRFATVRLHLLVGSLYVGSFLAGSWF